MVTATISPPTSRSGNSVALLQYGGNYLPMNKRFGGDDLARTEIAMLKTLHL
jgi:hypothetical protein